MVNSLKFVMANKINLSHIFSWIERRVFEVYKNGKLDQDMTYYIGYTHDLSKDGDVIEIVNTLDQDNFPIVAFDGHHGEGYGKNLLSILKPLPRMRRGYQACPAVSLGGEGTCVGDGYGIFTNCINLETLPRELFINNPQLIYLGGYGGEYYIHDDKVTSSNGYGAFYNCSSLKSLPDDLFHYTPLLESLGGFGGDGTDDEYGGDGFGAFALCSALTEIPKGLFDKLPELRSVGGNGGHEIYYEAGNGFGAFYGCVSLERVPKELFKYNKKLTSFGGCPDRHNKENDIENGGAGFGCFDGCLKLGDVTLESLQ